MKYLLFLCLLGALLCTVLAEEDQDSVDAYGKHGESKMYVHTYPYTVLFLYWDVLHKAMKEN